LLAPQAYLNEKISGTTIAVTAIEILFI